MYNGQECNGTERFISSSCPCQTIIDGRKELAGKKEEIFINLKCSNNEKLMQLI